MHAIVWEPKRGPSYDNHPYVMTTAMTTEVSVAIMRLGLMVMSRHGIHGCQDQEHACATWLLVQLNRRSSEPPTRHSSTDSST